MTRQASASRRTDGRDADVATGRDRDAPDAADVVDRPAFAAPA